MDEKKSGKQTNITFIGTRSPNHYVKCIAIQFTAKKEKEVIVKARGQNIDRAIEVCELVKKRFENEKPIVAKKVDMKDETMKGLTGKTKIVPTIEITLRKK